MKTLRIPARPYSQNLVLVPSAPGPHAAGLEETHVLKGGVNLRTGNIRHHGNLIIEGDVASGFRVEADGDILIEGSVEAAEVLSRNGSIRIRQSVLGQGKGRICAKGSIHVQSAQGACLECEGVLEVEKYLRNCKVEAGSIRAIASGCTVIGGCIKSYSGICIAVLGGEGFQTEVRLVDKQAESARLRLIEIGWQKQRALAKIPILENRVRTSAIIAKRLGPKMSNRMRAEVEEVLADYDARKKHLTALDKERDGLLEDLNSFLRHTGAFEVTEKLHGEVHLNLYGHVRALTSKDAGMEWHWTPESMAPTRSDAQLPLDEGSAFQENINKRHP